MTFHFCLDYYDQTQRKPDIMETAIQLKYRLLGAKSPNKFGYLSDIMDHGVGSLVELVTELGA